MHIDSAAGLVSEAPPDLLALKLLDAPATVSARRIFAVGDVGLCGHLAAPPGADPWAEVGPTLRGGDVVFANLETPLVPRPGDRRAPFVGPSSAAPRLAEGGFRVVNLANNHVADAGPQGIASTLAALHEVGIATVGAGADAEGARRLLVTELGSLKVGWLACARTLQKQPPGGARFWELDPAELAAAVRRARDEVDVLVVSLHLGYMFVDYPHPDHRRLALELAAAGADLVLAHHAHVVQGLEVTTEGAGLCHNLGDFWFDWTAGEIASGGPVELQRCGVVVVADVDAGGLRRLAVLPTRVDDDWVVRWQVGAAGRESLERLARISSDLHGDFAAEFHRQRGERNTGLALRGLGRSLRRGRIGPVLAVLPRLRPHHLGMLWRWLGGGLRR